MIEYISGQVADLSPALCVLEAHGVGYALNISLNTYTAVQGRKEALLFVHEVLVTGGRDDSYTLYGFATRREREIYRMLISVSGVGKGMARMILSALSPDDLVSLITAGDERQLKAVKGIGLKTAQRIIIELRDKMSASGIIAAPDSPAPASPEATQTQEEAIAALTMLGFAPAPTAKVVRELLAKQPDMHVEEVIKQALKLIK